MAIRAIAATPTSIKANCQFARFVYFDCGIQSKRSQKMCLECDNENTKYKCKRCNQFCCSFECFKKHEQVECTPENVAETNVSPKTADAKSKTILQFTTDDTVPREKLELLGQSEGIKNLLRNSHLRDFLTEVDSTPNAWKAMKCAMLEPLFTEFADECLKVIEPKEDQADH